MSVSTAFGGKIIMVDNTNPIKYKGRPIQYKWEKHHVHLTGQYGGDLLSYSK